jgi:hypothetical protein
MELDITRLARENEIDLHWTEHRWDAEAFPELRQAIVPRIRNVGDYLLGLHELGHVLAPEARAYDQDTAVYACLLTEGAAWAWAMANAAPEFVAVAKDEDWATVHEAIGSHYRWAALCPTRAPDEV